MNNVCEFLQPIESMAGRSLVLVLHTVTAITTLFTLKRMYQKTEIGHPVFALAFQELVILFICQTSGLAILASLVFRHEPRMTGLFAATASMAAHLHQITWLFITILRYYLLIHGKNNSFDMIKLRRKTMFAFWVVSILPLLGLQLMAFLITGYMYDKTKQSISGSSLLKDCLILYIPFNIPDIFSLIIYLNMVKQLNNRVKPEPIIGIEAEPYGGVWVGDVLEDVISSNLPPESSTVVENNEETKSVMKVLRRHVMAGFADISIVLTSYWFCSPLVGKSLAYFTQIAIGYWVPLTVIKSSFKQLS